MLFKSAITQEFFTGVKRNFESNCDIDTEIDENHSDVKSFRLNIAG